MARNIKTVLVDLSGTLHVGETPIQGAVASIQRLRHAGKHLRFVTNTSTKSSESLLSHLHRLGFHVEKEELITSVVATAKYLQRHSLRPFCLLEDTSDFDGMVDTTEPHNAVVVGLAPSRLNYANLNQAFRIVHKHRNLVAVHMGKYMQDSDGELSLGPGAFCRGLEHASGCEAVVVGKPSKEFFLSALTDGLSAGEACMIGDDAMQDIDGARRAGIGHAILVKTGKYRPGDEAKAGMPPSLVAESIVEATNYILDDGR